MGMLKTGKIEYAVAEIVADRFEIMQKCGGDLKRALGRAEFMKTMRTQFRDGKRVAVVKRIKGVGEWQKLSSLG